MSLSVVPPVPDENVSLWSRVPPLARDRQAMLSIEQIAEAAFELADQPGGLAATSVKRVAHRLGLPTARLEQYLPDRADLLDLMLDVALGQVQPTPMALWRESVESTARSLRKLAVRHPWLVELIGGRPPSGPNGLAFLEQSLSAFVTAGLPVSEAAQAVNAVHALVCGSIQMHVPRAGRAHAPSAGYLQSAVSGSNLTNLAALFIEPSGVSPDQAFEYGLACLLDGLSVRAATCSGI